MLKAGQQTGSLRHIEGEEKDELMVDLLTGEALDTSEIEGEILRRDSLQSSLRRHFGLQTEPRRIPPAEQGIADMMMDVYTSFDLPLTQDHLHQWHAKLMLGRRDLLDIGAYRTHEDPMQIVSGRVDRPTVHFEAPPSSRVPGEMQHFIEWFNNSGHLPCVTRAGIAHLYFESIHPYEDGNGRIGRALCEKALSQGLKQPTLIALSSVIAQNKKAYYSALHAGSIALEITDWLTYFSQLVLDAQEYTQKTIDLVIEKARFFHRYAPLMNDRQMKVVNRLFKAGIKGFQGGLSADNYMTIARTTASTATRDLQKLVEIGALRRTGERKGTRYFLKDA